MPVLMKQDDPKITFEIKRVITVSLKYVFIDIGLNFYFRTFSEFI